MERKATLNESSGKPISDLEALLAVMEKLLLDKLEQKPKAGLTLAKGQGNERRVKYSKALALFKGLQAYLEYRGCLSIGVCQTCSLWDNRAHGNPMFGTCARGGKLCHAWDTCPEHSKDGGGYGA